MFPNICKPFIGNIPFVDDVTIQMSPSDIDRRKDSGAASRLAGAKRSLLQSSGRDDEDGEAVQAKKRKVYAVSMRVSMDPCWPFTGRRKARPLGRMVGHKGQIRLPKRF